MPVNTNTNSKNCRPAEKGSSLPRERRGLGYRLAKLLRDTARALDLEGRSYLK